MPNTLDELLSRVAHARQSRRWAILLYSGGKFAGGIFDGNTEVAHKTLSNYTVRGKQGGGQGCHDASTGSGMGSAKSAGASLRRQGEMAIRADVSNLLHNRWRSFLQSCQLIFLWSPKVHRNIFFHNPTSSPTTQLDDEPVDEASRRTRTLSLSDLDPLALQAYQARLGMTMDDLRLRRIPCRRVQIAYSHVKEIQRELSTFDVYGMSDVSVVTSQAV